MKIIKAVEWSYPVNHRFTLWYKGKIVAEKKQGFNRNEVFQYAKQNGFTHVLFDYENVWQTIRQRQKRYSVESYFKKVKANV